MVKQLEDLAKLKVWYAKKYEEILELHEDLVKYSTMDLTDMAFAYQEMSEVMDDMRKEMNKLSERMQKIVCFRKLQKEDSSNVETETVSASLELKMSANLPSHSTKPKEYQKLLAWLGVPAPVIKTELMRVHWPTFTKFFSRLVAEGKPVPPGIDVSKNHAHYYLKFKQKEEK